ncbi:hypothetical protein CONLIGDRAFT_713885 [Coniochaeta ligniaria NRRL 30616]|uniref:Uncharacterized protein n=1 Tax=Coniochaeta ligniaria NRRL 30616 TaxID=1408157 RepID=A0A1J7IPC3_9PEZI|nr:hypothetical protein CONLIGDRAFT_713885 [Coniochaeta ligniaria NRRL 30616]
MHGAATRNFSLSSFSANDLALMLLITNKTAARAAEHMTGVSTSQLSTLPTGKSSSLDRATRNSTAAPAPELGDSRFAAVTGGADAATLGIYYVPPSGKAGGDMASTGGHSRHSGQPEALALTGMRW